MNQHRAYRRIGPSTIQNLDSAITPGDSFITAHCKSIIAALAPVGAPALQPGGCTMLESVFVILAAVAVGWLGHNVPAGSEPGQRTVGEVASLKASDFKAPTTSAQGERTLYAAEMSALQATLAVPLDPLTDTALPGALEAVALFNLNPNLARQHLLAAIPTLAEKSTDYQRQILTGAHTLYWMDAAPVIVQLLPKITTPKEFAIGAYTVLRAADTAPTRAQLRAQLLASFPQWEAEPRLIALERRLRAEPLQDLAARPPLRDLLGAPIRPGFPVVFSFQRKNRENPGLAMVRGADGRFVRNADGSLFHVAQLAMAKSRLPGTITNGNTPQGLFSIQGTVTATNPWIGPTPALESKVPKEASVEAFEHADASTPAVEWDESRYWSFFPASWQHYAPVREAWLAGLAGRDEMWIHGDTVNPDYYRNERFYPYAPSAGCLVAMEYWSSEDGTLVQSDQLAIVKAFASTGRLKGFLVVVEVDDRSQPVALADVFQDVIAAEGRL